MGSISVILMSNTPPPSVDGHQRHGAPQLLEILLDHTTTISGAPIQLNTLEIEHIFKTREHIIGVLQAQYKLSLLKQIYKAVLSFDFMGSPISLISSLSTGVQDFFILPQQGLLESPGAFMQGLGQGTLSLVGNTTSGVFGTASKITTAAGRRLAYLVTDDSMRR